jgi:hypothetical protein
LGENVMQDRKGGCLRGAVRYVLMGEPRAIAICERSETKQKPPGKTGLLVVSLLAVTAFTFWHCRGTSSILPRTKNDTGPEMLTRIVQAAAILLSDTATPAAKVTTTSR